MQQKWKYFLAINENVLLAINENVLQSNANKNIFYIYFTYV